MSAGEVDELFDIKNAFFTGNFQQCITEAQKIKPSDPDATVEKDVFLYRAYLAQKKFGVVRDEIGPQSNALIQPLKKLAVYLQNANQREELVQEMETEMSGTVDLNNHVLLLVAASIFYQEENYEAALRVLHPSDHLECMALKLQTLLKMDRIDLARKELKVMQDKDDDATLTQLAQAWVNLQMGGDKIQDAYYIYQEMIDKFGSTPLLLNGQASSFIQQGKFQEAEGALQEALEKDPNNAETLINMIVLSQQTGKAPEVSNRYLTLLKDDDPKHPFLKTYSQKESDFDRMIAQYAVTA
ncbi:hypothetical protein TCAL_02931 [Tigriopus californicus]|uniref:Coatomer subunit epsilon n=1 Tax=Tigriopus californicus TaxID=6832 RepID=A0A553NP83_TIGCA|nr:coatomer subunit epsilon-like [Tigriopus californicus]TRY67252.1 hypothetical protein TCAL_02931 [Tigriopus californicus]|eukprot:TCALIF_02931-PA protein Name:"Similar to COPE Coatomer subunit epsilon (Bos taurus)" AED:0.09 eAED:0.09 QI:97/1/1/1/1/1/5/108/298